MASARADPTEGYTGPVPWTGGGEVRQNRDSDSEIKSRWIKTQDIISSPSVQVT